jgi:dihydroorotate dehydrogenase
MPDADLHNLPRYDSSQSYDWNYRRAPDPVEIDVPTVPGEWSFCGRKVDSPLGVPAGPLLNGRWVLYYASLGFDVLTYKTVRSSERACYPLPNLQPVECGQLKGGESDLRAIDHWQGSWAVAFGMPSAEPAVWRADVQQTRERLPANKLLSVSVVGTVQAGWTIDELAEDYARCARWAVEAGADAIETNFSCPNVATCDGQLYTQPQDAALVAQKVREAIGRVPFIVKVGHVEQSEAAATLLDAIGPHVSALAMTNSVATTIVDEAGKRLFDGQQRGICGAATREASLRQTRLFADLVAVRNLDVELIGVGGAATAADVQAYLAAGAGAVHLATAAMIDPAAGLEIRRAMHTAADCL